MYSICFTSSTTRCPRPWMSIASSIDEYRLTFGWELNSICCITLRMASPALRRRTFAEPSGGMSIRVGGWIDTVICGNSLRGYRPDRRLNQVRAGPSRRTGTSVAPVFAATKAGPS